MEYESGLLYNITILCLSVLLVACADTQGRPEAGDVAVMEVQRDLSWINGQAGMEGKICAVGYMGASFYPEHARQGASDQCRTQLARNLQSTIVSMDIDWASDRGGQYAAGASVSATRMATDAVVDNVEMVDYFYDKDGRYSAGGATMTYVLCCVPESVINGLKK